MSLFEILQKEYDLTVNPTDKFDLVDVSQYFDEEDNRYKHIRGVAAQMQLLTNGLHIKEEEQQKLMLIAYLHDIGYSKRLKDRGHHALNGAIFSLEKAFGEDVALAILFHTASYGEIKLMNNEVLNRIYKQAKNLLKQNEQAKYYIDLITYCDLHTESTGEPTTLARRIFKISAQYQKDSTTYQNIKSNRNYFKKLDKRIRLSVIKEKTFFEGILDVLRAK